MSIISKKKQSAARRTAVQKLQRSSQMLQQLDTKDENDAGSIHRKSQLLALPDVRLAQELDNYKKLLAQKEKEISTLRQQMVAKVEPTFLYDLESIKAGKTDLVAFEVNVTNWPVFSRLERL